MTPSERSALARKIVRYRQDPVAFVREVLHAEPDAWQCKVLEALPHNQRLAMKACKGPGKSCLMAWVIWWYLFTRKDSKVIATSVTEPNLKDGLWSELRLWQGRSPILMELFTWTASRITSKERPETWFASARTWAQDADPTQQSNSLAGVHADNVLFALDEVSEYPEGVVAAAEGGLTSGPNCKIIVAGNPTRTSGPLYRICTKDRAKWWVIEITGDPEDPLRAPRVDLEWARHQIEVWGIDSSFVRVNVLGKFPHGQANKVIALDVIEAAGTRVLPPQSAMEVKVLGVDCARFGDARSVLFPRQGLVAYRPKILRERTTMELSGDVVEYDRVWHPDWICIDTSGMGVGVYDRLREQGLHHVIGVDGGMRSSKKGFANRRADLWFACRDWLKVGAIPRMDELQTELGEPIYKFASNGSILIESKDEMRKRGVQSPDVADGLVLTFAAPARSRRELDAGVAIRDFDPFEEENQRWAQ